MRGGEVEEEEGTERLWCLSQRWEWGRGSGLGLGLRFGLGFASASAPARHSVRGREACRSSAWHRYQSADEECRAG